uniref:Angiotensin-converting enzyme n=1 Tax=Timema cristinae TaxID=61476 RepID=A0A7R9D6K5_TIMCR|nr:unnamed protein product [Timema cristinae]
MWGQIWDNLLNISQPFPDTPSPKVTEALKQQLHAYVRRKLYLKYGVSIVDPRRGIPAHLLGNMWGQIWDNLLNISQPFPDTPSPKVTEALKQQGFTSRKMFQVAEEFFVSLNLSAMPPLFWRNSILEKPAKRRRVNCHSSAWDFMDRKDFRILQCSDVSLRSFLTAHHEMGHIENFVLYKDQPPTYREGANPGFDEAIGDVITLSVMSPKHLKKIGLLSDDEHVGSYESNINHLFSVALRKLTLLPFAYVIDLWRWAVFQGSVTPRNYNCHWWYLREKYQGVVPPEKRSEEQFDPGSKFHVAANVPYIRYFISAILEFQMHRHMCEVVGEYDPNDTRKPLHSCDIYQKQQAGTLLRRVMSMGSSQPWPEALKVITGSRCMDASALREYLLPLEHWLTVENEKTGELIGWEHTGEDRATSGGSGMTVAFIIFAVATFLHLWESQCWQLLTAAWSALHPNESVSPSLRHLVHTVEVQMLDRLTGSKNCSHLVMDQDKIN